MPTEPERTGRTRLGIASWALLLLAAWSAGCRPGGEWAGAEKAAVDAAVARGFPALVRIHVVTAEHMEGREQKYEASGSGTIISPEGHVLTNYHVVGRARWIRCTLTSKDEADAVLVGKDALSDIAVIKMDPSTMRHPVETFPCAEFGDSDGLRVGDRVLAMGSPMALSQSVTSGIVSNTEMVMPAMWGGWVDLKLDGEEVGTLVRWIAHDAAIYGGNSGGPLVDLTGRVVGVNEMRLGLSGAIPGNLARAVTEELIGSGEIRRSWIGADVQPLLRSSGLERGVLVGGVAEGSPAERAGLRAGDVIVGYDGRPVRVRWAEELPGFNRMLLGTPVGRAVRLSVLREGAPVGLEVVTEVRGKARDEDRELREWGATMRDLTLLAAKELKRESTDGVLVTSVRPGGPCGQAKPEVREGDIIVRMGGAAIRNLADLEAATRRIAGGRTEPEPVVVAFDRKTRRLLSAVRIGPSERENRPPEARKAWFPAEVQVFTRDLAEAMGLEKRKGVLITQLHPAAEEAGFELGDIITRMDGQVIDASQPEDGRVFPAMVRRYRIGAETEMSVIREGREMRIPVRLAVAPKPAGEMREFRDETFEFTARDVAFADRAREKWREDQRGAYVEAVEQAGWAALAHMAVGDLLLAVNGEEVRGAADLERLMGEIAKSRPRHIVFFVRRGIHTLFLELEPDWERSE